MCAALLEALRCSTISKRLKLVAVTVVTVLLIETFQFFLFGLGLEPGFGGSCNNLIVVHHDIFCLASLHLSNADLESCAAEQQLSVRRVGSSCCMATRVVPLFHIALPSGSARWQAPNCQSPFAVRQYPRLQFFVA
jgi:hypothetical protein